MEISLKQLKKLVQNEALLKMAKELDKNKNKKLDGNEISIFESRVYEGVKNNSFKAEEYSSIFGHDVSERLTEPELEINSNSINKKNIIISFKDGIKVIAQPKLNEIGSITGEIKLKDTNGKEHSIKLTIMPSQIRGMDGNNLQQYLERIINKLSQAINELPPEVKSDFYNEIKQVNIGGEKYPTNNVFNKPHANFDESNNTINLNILGDNESSLSSETLMHEIGHSVDHLDRKFLSDDNLKQKYENLKNILKAKGFDTENYSKNKDVQGYWLKDNLESIAEFYVYYHKAQRGDKYITEDSRYNMLHKVATSNDPEIQKAFKEFEAEFVNIMNKSRGTDPEFRKGDDFASKLSRFNHIRVKVNPNTNKEVYHALCILGDQVKTDKDLTGAQELVKQYFYIYSQKSNPDEEWNKIFNDLETKNSKEWQTIKEFCKKIYEENNLSVATAI